MAFVFLFLPCRYFWHFAPAMTMAERQKTPTRPRHPQNSRTLLPPNAHINMASGLQQWKPTALKKDCKPVLVSCVPRVRQATLTNWGMMKLCMKPKRPTVQKSDGICTSPAKDVIIQPILKKTNSGITTKIIIASAVIIPRLLRACSSHPTMAERAWFLE